MSQFPAPIGPRQDPEELRSWSSFFSRLTSKRGALTALAAREVDLSRNLVGEKDHGGVMARYSAYRSAAQRPHPDTAFLIGELAYNLAPPYTVRWSSGFISLYAAGHFSQFVLLFGALCEFMPLGRLDAILGKTLTTITTAWPANIEKWVMPYIAMQRLPTFDEVMTFRDKFSGHISSWDFLSYRQRYRRDIAAQRVLTFGPKQHELLAANYQLIAHGSTHQFKLREPLRLAYEVANCDEIPLKSKRLHLARHLSDVMLALHTEAYVRRRKTSPGWLLESRQWKNRLRYLCGHARLTVDPDGDFRCVVCGVPEGTENTKRHELLDKRIAHTLFEASYRDIS